jgi:hypothetical protein
MKEGLPIELEDMAFEVMHTIYIYCSFKSLSCSTHASLPDDTRPLESLPVENVLDFWFEKWPPKYLEVARPECGFSLY